MLAKTQSTTQYTKIKTLRALVVGLDLSNDLRSGSCVFILRATEIINQEVVLSLKNI